MVPTKDEWMKALVERHGVENQRKFSEATVAICGLGGLGSNIAICLARASIGKLVLIDFDRVDVTNLHRQQYKISQIGQYKTDALIASLREINPYVELESHAVCITEDNALVLLKSCDIICEAFDNPESKAMLINLVLETIPEKYLVAASGMAGFGDANAIRTRNITKYFYLCGDFVSAVEEGIGLISSRVMICAAHQAHTVLQILMNERRK